MAEYWTTRERKKVKICDMSDRHLVNSYNMLANKLIVHANRCMSRNEEEDVPEEFLDLVYSLEYELDKRHLLIKA